MNGGNKQWSERQTRAVRWGASSVLSRAIHETTAEM